MLPLSRLFAIALLVGTLLMGVGAAMHPMLVGDVANQLRVIAATAYFRPLHLAMLTGSGLLIVGIWTRALDRDGSFQIPLFAALGLISLGICFNAIDIAFMAGAGSQMATTFVAGGTEMGTLFDMFHLVGLMTARFGNFLVALGALVLGWVESQEAANPRWLAWLAWIAGAGGLIGVVFFPERSLAILTAIALLSGWQVATGIRVLRAPSLSA